MERISRNSQDYAGKFGDLSLSNFVETWSDKSSPLTLLLGFVAEVSINSGRVYANDPAGSSILTTCLLECLDVLAHRTGLSREFLPSWSLFRCSQTSEAQLTALQLFAVDLFHTELRLRRCEFDDRIDADYDGDGNFVSSMIPTLLGVLQDIEATPNRSQPPGWTYLKVRCYWLIAGIFLWRGRLSSNVSESRQAESEGLHFVELALDILAEGERVVVETPYLTSPKRSGLHWRELSVMSLSSFRNEIRASSVLLVTQEKFFEATSRMEGPEDKVLDESDRESLSKIGETMLARYNDAASDQSSPKHIELVEDFLLVHGKALLSPEFVADSALLAQWFDDLFPIGLVNTEGVLLGRNKCILTILVVCLQTRPDREGDLVLLLHRLIE